QIRNAILARFVGDAGTDLGDERWARRFNRDAREHGTRRVAHGSGEALRCRQTGSRAEECNDNQQSNQQSIHERTSTAVWSRGVPDTADALRDYGPFAWDCQERISSRATSGARTVNSRRMRHRSVCCLLIVLPALSATLSAGSTTTLADA